MLPKKLYNLLLGLLPIVYIFHNLEEWYVLNGKLATIIKIVPQRYQAIISNDPKTILSVFGVALIVATVIPLVVAILLWKRVTILNIKILLMIAFVTLINTISHISSSFALGFISPGFITGILICLPYSIAIVYVVNKFNKISIKTHLAIGLGSTLVFVLGLGISWLIGVLVLAI